MRQEAGGMLDLKFGIAKKRDLPDILRIENETFQEDAWTRNAFMKVMNNKSSTLKVITLDEEVVAYSVDEFHPNGIEIRTFAVAPELRRQGVGTYTANLTLFAVSRSPRLWARTTVRESNLPGQMFLKSLGFHTERILPGPVRGVDEDHITLRVIPGDHIPSMIRVNRSRKP